MDTSSMYAKQHMSKKKSLLTTTAPDLFGKKCIDSLFNVHTRLHDKRHNLKLGKLKRMYKNLPKPAVQHAHPCQCGHIA